jgi:hypothetical protein
VHDLRLADDLRVQPRRCHPGLEALVGTHAHPRPGQRGHARRRLCSHPDPPGAAKGGHQRHPRAPGVLRRHLDRRDRALPGLRDPHLPALAARGELRGGLVDQRQQVQVDEPDRGRRDRHRVALPDDAHHAGGQHLQQPVLLEVRQLRPDRDCGSPGHPSGTRS